jgi:hypothetical protein
MNTSDKENSQAKVSLRISGKEPKVWNPMDGSISQVSYAMNKGRTEVTLNMDPEDAVFVVFRKPTSKNSSIIPEVEEKELATIKAKLNQAKALFFFQQFNALFNAVRFGFRAFCRDNPGDVSSLIRGSKSIKEGFCYGFTLERSS